MPKIKFDGDSLDEFSYWLGQDIKTARKIDKLLHELARNPNSGLGKAERLKGNRSGTYSRRIDHANRLIYTIDGDTVNVLHCKGHYDDK